MSMCEPIVANDITGRWMQLLHGLCCFDFVSDIPIDIKRRKNRLLKFCLCTRYQCRPSKGKLLLFFSFFCCCGHWQYYRSKQGALKQSIFFRCLWICLTPATLAQIVLGSTEGSLLRIATYPNPVHHEWISANISD